MRKSALMLWWTVWLVFTLGCGSEKGTNSGTSDGFPLTIGTHWVYYAHDSLSAWYDTVDVEIIRDSTVKGGIGRIVSTTFRCDGCRGNTLTTSTALFEEGLSLAVQRGDTFYVNPLDPIAVTSLMLVSPVEPGQGWSRPEFGGTDTSFCSSIDTVVAPAGEFRDSRHVRQLLWGLDCGWVLDHWFAPEVGIVSHRYQSYADMCGETESVVFWELVAYDIPSE